MKIIRCNSFPIPRGMSAITIGSWIFIRPQAEASVLLHEMVHVEQFKNDWLFPIKYLFSASYRYNAAIEAYRVSIEHGLSLKDAVNYLAHDYFFNKTKEEIVRDLL